MFDICFDAHIAGFSDCFIIVGRSCVLELETSVVRFGDAFRPFFAKHSNVATPLNNLPCVGIHRYK